MQILHRTAPIPSADIVLRISGDQSHTTEFLCYDREFEFIA